MLLTQWIRVFFEDDTTYTDLSLDLAARDQTVSLPYVAAEDYVYIAQDMPFNNIYVQMSTVNAAASSAVIELWDGNNWVAAVDVLDGTSLAGASLGRSGVIQFTPDEDETWHCVSDSRDDQEDMGIGTNMVLFNHYWLRLSFSADLDAGTALRRVAYNFATDEQLEAVDPEIDLFRNSWEDGKVDWTEQIIKASEYVVADFKARRKLKHPGQLLRLDEISLATAHRALILIYEKFGAGFEYQRARQKEAYDELLNGGFTIDRNKTGAVEVAELSADEARGVR